MEPILLNVLKRVLILDPSLQNYLFTFCNLFSVNLEKIPMKRHLNYWIFSLVLLDPVSLFVFKIFFT